MRFASILIVSLLVLGGGTYGLLIFTGAIKLGPKQVPKAQGPLLTGAILVPFTFKDLNANTRMTRELLTNPKNGQLVKQAVMAERN